MNDWWNYLEHSGLGKERKGHKYYARVQTGTNKLGFPQYRYFYDAREYGAYIANQKNGKGNPLTRKTKGYTTYVTGVGKQMLPASIANEDVNRLRGTGVASTHKMTNEKGEWTGASAVVRAKTVKDYGKYARKAKDTVHRILREARESHNANRWGTYKSITSANGTGTYYQKNRINGKTRDGVVTESNRNEFTTAGWKKRKKEEKTINRNERIYQTEKFAHRASVAAKKGALRVKRLLKSHSKK